MYLLTLFIGEINSFFVFIIQQNNTSPQSEKHIKKKKNLNERYSKLGTGLLLYLQKIYILLYIKKKIERVRESVYRAKDVFSCVLLKRGLLKCGEDCRLDSTFTQEMSLPFLFYVCLQNSQLDSVLCQKGIFLSAESLYLLLFLSAEIWIR